VENVIGGLLLILLLSPIIAILVGLLLAFPAILLGVALVMDGGCLRYLLFGVGWIIALFYGLLAGLLIGEGLLGLEFLIEPIFYTFTLGYPAAGYWGRRTLQSMPEERYKAWEQTLTGGALFGFGAGSIAGLLRSAASGFGGVGGGSFGGGGASGSWSGTSGAASASSAAGSASAPAAAESSSDPSTSASSRGFWTRLRQWFQKFQWYHGFVFGLATLVFVPLGLGTMWALQNTKFFVFALVGAVLYSGYKLLKNNPDIPQTAVRSLSSWGGGEASGSWS